MFKKKKQKNNAGKIRRARVKNARKGQVKKAQSKKRSTRKRKKLAGRRGSQPKKINWKKLGVLLLMLCFVIFSGWVLFFSKVMQINEVKIIGYDEKRAELLEQVEELKKKKLLNQKVDNNLALFPSRKLAKSIKEKYSIVRRVEVQKIFPDKLVVNITKRQQTFLWRHLESCQLLDEEGDVVEEFSCSRNEKELLKICDNKKEILGLDCQVFIREDNGRDDANDKAMQAIIKAGQQILEEIRTTFYFDNELIIIVPNPASKEIKVKSEIHGEIWFATDRDLKRQLEKFRALLEKKINSSDLENMLYIDLRLNDKIIYRLKEGVVETENISEDDVIKQ
jgi:cell division septal protein FtsQ